MSVCDSMRNISLPVNHVPSLKCVCVIHLCLDFQFKGCGFEHQSGLLHVGQTCPRSLFQVGYLISYMQSAGWHSLTNNSQVHGYNNTLELNKNEHCQKGITSNMKRSKTGWRMSENYFHKLSYFDTNFLIESPYSSLFQRF